MQEDSIILTFELSLFIVLWRALTPDCLAQLVLVFAVMHVTVKLEPFHTLLWQIPIDSAVSQTLLFFDRKPQTQIQEILSLLFGKCRENWFCKIWEGGV